jgi:hypothetical protein
MTNMVEVMSNDSRTINEEVVKLWLPNGSADFGVALTENGVMITLNDLPKFNPMTGEELSFPEENDETA